SNTPPDSYSAASYFGGVTEMFTSNERELIESYYHRFLKLMNDLKRNKHFPEKIASNLKFLNNLQPEWSQHVTIVHQTKDLHTADYTQLYDFLKNNQKENYLQQPMPNPEDITDPTTAMNMALTLMAKAFKLNYSTLTNNNQRISSNLKSRQIAQPGMNIGQNRQIQMVEGYSECCSESKGLECWKSKWFNWCSRDWKSKSNREWPRKRDAAYLQTQLLIAQKEEAGIQLQAEEYDLMVAAADIAYLTYATSFLNTIWAFQWALFTSYTKILDTTKWKFLVHQATIAGKAQSQSQGTDTERRKLGEQMGLDEIEEVNANCILMANLQQASTSGTQTDSAPVYDTDGSVENDNYVISEDTSVEQGAEIVEQHPANFEETRALYESLYQNLAIKVEKVNSVNRKLKETNADMTTELTRYKNHEMCFEISQEKYDKLESVVKQRMTIETHNWSSFAHQELHKIVRDLNFPIVNQVDARVQNFEIQFLKEAAKFVGDFKSLAKEADDSLAKHKALELETERLLKAVVSPDVMNIVQKESVVDTSDLQTELERTKERFENCIIKKETEYAKLWNDWYKKCDECKYDKISYDKAYKDMQQKIERLQAQLRDLKGKSKDTSYVSDTYNPLSQKLENENVELEF
nr:hypothetical protein [Tanacetum cinerariifolium]